MEKQPISEDITPKHRQITRTPAFGILIVSFLIVKIVTLVFLPNRQYTLASDLTTQNIMDAVNNERSLRNLVVLNTNGDLTEAAQSKSDDMIARKYFAHVDPDGHYIWDKIVADGYTPYTMLGENLAIEFYDTDSLMSAWMNSPEHRANILQAGFRDQGMGIGFGDVQQGQYYSAITNTFGALAVQPKAPAAKATAAPAAATKKVETPVGTENVKPAPSAPTQVVTPNKPQNNASTSPAQPIETRGVVPKNSVPSSNVILTPQPESPVSTPIATQQPALAGQSASAVIGNDQSTVLTDYDTNRYLILICGVALLLLMLSDIRIALEKKLGHIDKKFNNLAVLLISLIVIAFMYWL